MRNSLDDFSFKVDNFLSLIIKHKFAMKDHNSDSQI